MSKRVHWQTAYAVVRIDPGLRDAADFNHFIKVVSVSQSQEFAQSEADRLNSLNSGKGPSYFWQSTHFFPQPVPR